MTAEPYGRIYVIINKLTGKEYVGQTTFTLERRWRGHVHAMSNRRRTQPITAALRKYGVESFVMRELAQCDSQEALDAAEKAWAVCQNTFAPHGYNLRAGNGIGAVSQQARDALRSAMTPERRQALSELWQGRRLPERAYIAAAATFAERRRPWTLINPSGESIVISNPGKFCKEVGLSYSNLRAVAWGVRPSHQGWRLVADPLPATLFDTDESLVCPGCRSSFSRAMRAAAQTHATACANTPHAVRAAVDLGHCTSEEAAKAVQLLAGRRGTVRAIPRPRKHFVLLNPEGEEVEGVGVVAFAAAHHLDKGKLSELLNGKRDAHKGWKLAVRRPGRITSAGC
ncbi:group I intron endonuclease [Micromonospora pisi]|uniref:Group I intron endonuclease n=1 Tax=Micromonospora pisi TaxID=589240 RepID=A0A495JWX9_9ACTN|nr:GIY-YIG nuclease family protein [Micromonospora pisi]RKR92679.1 group I intron endonuclease [Micromonospora pisi]